MLNNSKKYYKDDMDTDGAIQNAQKWIENT